MLGLIAMARSSSLAFRFCLASRYIVASFPTVENFVSTSRDVTTMSVPKNRTDGQSVLAAIPRSKAIESTRLLLMFTMLIWWG